MGSTRECAYQILEKFFKEGLFIEKTLTQYVKKLSSEDGAFLKRLCFGVIKNYVGLCKYFQSLHTGKTRLKRSEKLLAALGLYQVLFMDNVPSYAAINETLNVAKKHAHQSFSKKLNAILRQINKQSYGLFLQKQGFDARYSLSQDLLEELLGFLSKRECEHLLEIYQKEKITQFRLLRKGRKENLKPFQDSIRELEEPFYEVIDTKIIKDLSLLKDIYFQNQTPYQLFHFLKNKQVKSVLDVCAAPGGKLILAHEEFAKAELFGNDISEKRLETIRENLEKYGIDALLTVQDGLTFEGGPFELVILDVPCSNTGVIRKKPEVKLSFTKEKLKQLTDLQKALLKHSLSLLSSGGQLWYMTCSILSKENEDIMAYAEKTLGVKVLKSQIGRAHV